MENKLTKAQVTTILQNAPKGSNPGKIVDGLVKRGYILEGFNEPKSTVDTVKDVAIGTAKGFVNGAVVEPVKMVESAGKAILGVTNDASNALANKARGAVGLPETQTPRGMQLQSTSALAPIDNVLIPTNEDQKTGNTIGTGLAFVAPFGPSIVSKTGKGVKAIGKATGSGIDASKNAIKNTVDEALFNPTAEQATLTNLNPFIDKVADVSIPVRQPNGLVNYVVKKSADATPQEIEAYKSEAQDLYTKFTEQGKKFLKDRSVEGGSPVEQVGVTIDKATKQVDTIRRAVGKNMNTIEDAATNIKIKTSELPTVSDFLNVVQQAKNGKIASYGADEGVTKEVSKLAKDIMTLESRGSNVGETLSLTRKWAQYLENQKDKFGDFKDNKFANSAIEKTINALKNSARDTLAENDDTYRKLVAEYRKTSQFRDEAKRLLGQEGLYGDSIKGSATAKRAIQSNSDGGARQFLKTLRDLTGYDAMKEADIALKAMKDVGDYQGLSLLGVLSDVQGGVMGTAKNIAKKLTPSEAKRTSKYIKK